MQVLDFRGVQQLGNQLDTANPVWRTGRLCEERPPHDAVSSRPCRTLGHGEGTGVSPARHCDERCPGERSPATTTVEPPLTCKLAAESTFAVAGTPGDVLGDRLYRLVPGSLPYFSEVRPATSVNFVSKRSRLPSRAVLHLRQFGSSTRPPDRVCRRRR